MEEKTLKTSWKQRVAIIIVAVLLLGSVVLTYMLVVLNGNSSSDTSSEAQIAELTEEYQQKSEEIEAAAKPLSDKYFDEFVKYKSEVKSYNSANANAAGLETKDLKEGTGRTLTEGDTDYAAYYIGWCADGSIFDSSFNDNEDPSSLKAPLDAGIGLIEGWNQGVIGMKLGGIRQISMSGALAYGDTQEICGGTNSPLKFVVFAMEPDAKIKELNEELDDIYMRLYYAYAGGSNL